MKYVILLNCSVLYGSAPTILSPELQKVPTRQLYRAKIVPASERHELSCRE